MSLIAPDEKCFIDEWRKKSPSHFSLAMGDENDYEMLLHPFSRKLLNMSDNN